MNSSLVALAKKLSSQPPVGRPMTTYQPQLTRGTITRVHTSGTLATVLIAGSNVVVAAPRATTTPLQPGMSVWILTQGTHVVILGGFTSTQQETITKVRAGTGLFVTPPSGVGAVTLSVSQTLIPAARIEATTKITTAPGAGDTQVKGFTITFQRGTMLCTATTITIPSSGVYYISAAVYLQKAGGSVTRTYLYEAQIRITGSQTGGRTNGVWAVSHQPMAILVSDILLLTSGANISLWVYNGSSSTIGVGFNVTHPIWLSVTKAV